jgi:hypothetical protein
VNAALRRGDGYERVGIKNFGIEASTGSLSPVRPSLLWPFFMPDDAFDTSVEAPEEAPKFPPIVRGHVASFFHLWWVSILPCSSRGPPVSFSLQVHVEWWTVVSTWCGCRSAYTQKGGFWLCFPC